MRQVEVHKNSEMLLHLPYMETIIHETVHTYCSIAGTCACQVSRIVNEIQAPGKLINVKLQNLLLVAIFPVLDTLHLLVFVYA